MRPGERFRPCVRTGACVGWDVSLTWPRGSSKSLPPSSSERWKTSFFSAFVDGEVNERRGGELRDACTGVERRRRTAAEYECVLITEKGVGTGSESGAPC